MTVVSVEEALRLARAAVDRGAWPEVSHLATAVLASIPGHPEAAGLACRALAHTGQPEAAAIVCRSAVEHQLHRRSENTAAQALAVLRTRGFAPRGILDVGAYEGDWAKLALDVFPDARVLMIEAQARLQSKLAALVAASGHRAAYEIALLGRENSGAVPFFQMETPYGSTGSSIYYEQTSFKRVRIELPMRRLDEIIATHEWAPFQLLKIDVQGSELDVLAGASALLPGVHAVFMEISFVEYNKGAPLLAQSLTAMDGYGFQLTDLADLRRGRGGALLQADAIFLRKGSPNLAQPPFA